jgi:hypothetical protein
MENFLGLEMYQEWSDLHVWNQFFIAHPVRTFVELGTGHGGMAFFFALQCYQRKINFYTFDNQNYFDFVSGVPGLMHMIDCFHFVDIFKEGAERISQIVQLAPHPLILFCDNGDKPREWRTFGPWLHPGDFIAVHDWGTEFKETDIVDFSVEKIMEDQRALETHSMTMWFRKLE